MLPPRRHSPWCFRWALIWVWVTSSIGRATRSGLVHSTKWARPSRRAGRCAVSLVAAPTNDSPDPTPLGPTGTPLVPALTHSTSGIVTGSNVRLGTSKDLSTGHETRLQRFDGDDNTHQGAASKCSDYHHYTRSCLRHHHLGQRL